MPAPPFNLWVTCRCDKAGMSKAFALAANRIAMPAPAEAARSAIVCGCALLLIAAGQALPVLGL
ncbi:hypothetical protein GCM10011617_02770 [Novosphingobium arvoryzae]|uniref:Uncharacterized protein n=1 Tax=Novosphingobium arvoryzae TaxID=1256514 RepID=A0A918VCV9_9SPHN|nr:hypothetical protein GCM10011617_02770 [Novosphingobium arvoryzae]